MSKKEEKNEEIVVDETIIDEKPSDRKKRWDAFVANYAIENPVKFASKKANGEFKEIPASFR